MADQQNVIINSSQIDSNDARIEYILQLNDDCLLALFQYFSAIELSYLNETCKRFQYIARDVFKGQWKSKEYKLDQKVKHVDHSRILRCFGDLVKEVGFINIVDNFGDRFITADEMERAFDLVERYCANTIEAVRIVDKSRNATFLPSSAATLIAQVKTATIWTSINCTGVQPLLCKCEKLVELNLHIYDGPVSLENFHFPQLRILTYRAFLLNDLDFEQLKRFFEKHSKLTKLVITFLAKYGIDLSFIGHLMDLETLGITLCGSALYGISHVEAFAKLTKLKKLIYRKCLHVPDTDATVLEHFTSLDLQELELAVIDRLTASIDRFKNLKCLRIEERSLRAPITSIPLSQLRSSGLIQIKIKCTELRDPTAIAVVFRNLRELKVLMLWCKVDLKESICMELVSICKWQNRNIKIILSKDIIKGMEDIDFKYIDKFNEKYGNFVRIVVRGQTFFEKFFYKILD